MIVLSRFFALLALVAGTAENSLLIGRAAALLPAGRLESILEGLA